MWSEFLYSEFEKCFVWPKYLRCCDQNKSQISNPFFEPTSRPPDKKKEETREKNVIVWSL